MALAVQASEYIQVTPSQLIDALDYLIPARIPAMIIGWPGIGKSDIVQDRLAEHYGAEFDGQENVSGYFPFFANTKQPSIVDGFGMPDRERNLMVFYPFMRKTGLPYAVFMDEIATASPAMKAACADMLLNPHRYLPDGSYVCGAANRIQDKNNSSAMPSHFNRRMVYLQLMPDLNDWTRLELACGEMAPEMVAYARQKPDCIVSEPDLAARSYACPATVSKLGRMMARGMPASVESQLMCGTIGDVHGIGAYAFRRVFRSGRMIDPDQVLSDPSGAPLPEAFEYSDVGSDGKLATRRISEMEITFAVMTALTFRADTSNFDSIVTYASRLDREYGHALVKDCTVRKPRLIDTAAYGRFETAVNV